MFPVIWLLRYVVRDALWNVPVCPLIGVEDGTVGEAGSPYLKHLKGRTPPLPLYHDVNTAGRQAAFHKTAGNKPALIEVRLHHGERSICLIGRLLSNILARDLFEAIIMKSLNGCAFSTGDLSCLLNMFSLA